MVVARTASENSAFAGGVLVPTMGALHAGHVSLFARAREAAQEMGGVGVVATVFVNPAQFNDPGDFARYPRDEAADLAACERAGVDCVYVPSVEEVYPGGASACGGFVVPAVGGGVAGEEPGLEDRHRPGHFEGVCRVCVRLFELTGARAAVFGEKDWQQLRVIRAMVERDGLGVEVLASATVREADGLAMSSRNRLLDAAARGRAASIRRAIERAQSIADAGEAEREGRAVMEAGGVEAEYFAVRDAETLLGVRAGGAARVLAAGVCAAEGGAVRLIDNDGWCVD